MVSTIHAISNESQTATGRDCHSTNAMALSKLSHNEQEILCLNLCNVLHPGLAVALGTVNNELREATEKPLCCS